MSRLYVEAVWYKEFLKVGDCILGRTYRLGEGCFTATSFSPRVHAMEHFPTESAARQWVEQQVGARAVEEVEE